MGTPFNSLWHRSTTQITLGGPIGLSVGNAVWGFREKYAFDHNSTSSIILRRDDALKSIEDGALIFEVRMKKPKDYRLPSFLPENPSMCKTVQGLFMDKESADVVFEVGGRPRESGRKKSKTETTEFYAHRIILKTAAPLLAELCNSDDSPSRIKLPNESPQIFHHLLYYIYGCNIPDFESDIAHTKGIIEAADKFGVTYLKLAAEANYVSSTTIDFDNMMECLHFAVSKNCALL